MSYGPENERDTIQREDDAQSRHDQRERAGIHYWESAADDREAIAILQQIGYHRTDTKFMSLNLSDEQFDAISEAVKQGGGKSPEEIIAAGCRCLVIVPRETVPCEHPWHDNPGLITPCPSCGVGG